MRPDAWPSPPLAPKMEKKKNRYAKPIPSVPALLSSTHRARLAPLSRARDLPAPNLATPLSRSRLSPCPFPPLPVQRLTLPPTCTGSARHQPRRRPPTPPIRPLLAHPYTTVEACSAHREECEWDGRQEQWRASARAWAAGAAGNREMRVGKRKRWNG